MSGTALTTLYGILAVGAAGLYGLLPGAAHRSRRAAVVCLLASLAGFLVLGAQGLGWTSRDDFYFCVFGAVALIGAVRVVTHSRPVYSALYFVLVVLAVAGLLVLADAEFLAAALVIIYAGAILVTYVFVIMLAQQVGAPEYDTAAKEPLAAVLVAFVLVASVGSLMGHRLPANPIRASSVLSAPAASPSVPEEVPDNVVRLGGSLLTQYVVAVEIAGALLLVAMVGAIWIARRQVPVPPSGKLTSPPGQIGRGVPPY